MNLRRRPTSLEQGSRDEREVERTADLPQVPLPGSAAECLFVSAHILGKARACHLQNLVDTSQVLYRRQVGAKGHTVDADQIDDVVEVPQEVVEARFVGGIAVPAHGPI